MLKTYLAGEMSPPRLDRRGAERVALNGKALVQVRNAKDFSQRDMAFHAGVLNASSSGLRLTAEQRLDDCELEIWVGLEDQLMRLNLVCEVIWTSWEGEGEFQMGVEVLNRENTDFAAWQDLFAHLG